MNTIEVKKSTTFSEIYNKIYELETKRRELKKEKNKLRTPLVETFLQDNFLELEKGRKVKIYIEDISAYHYFHIYKRTKYLYIKGFLLPENSQEKIHFEFEYQKDPIIKEITLSIDCVNEDFKEFLNNELIIKELTDLIEHLDLFEN